MMMGAFITSNQSLRSSSSYRNLAQVLYSGTRPLTRFESTRARALTKEGKLVSETGRRIKKNRKINLEEDYWFVQFKSPLYHFIEVSTTVSCFNTE
jgi:hypothetical protein